MTFLRGQRYSILPALMIDGIIALDIFEGLVTKEKFLSFLRTHLVRKFDLHFGVYILIFTQAPQLNPYPEKNSVVVMDNCSIHHDEEIRKLIVDECGEDLTKILIFCFHILISMSRCPTYTSSTLFT
jgi:hypothetical protein